MALSVQPIPQQSLANYHVVQSTDGGWNYFFNNKAISREQYAAGSGNAYNADPAVRVVAPPSGPKGSGGAAAPAKVDKSNEISLNLAGLASADSQHDAGVASINTALGNLQGDYAKETGVNEGNYRTQSDTNQNNFQKNKQTSLVNAAQGRQGLYGTLSSLGALNGSGIDLANRAVAKGANDDLSGAADSFAANQSGLDESIGTYRLEDERRNKDAVASAEGARANVANDRAKFRQGAYTTLANDYTAMGDEATGKSYAAQANALYPELARTNVPNTNLVRSAAAYTPAALSNYMAGANSTQVTATPTVGGGALPGLVAGQVEKKKQLAPV